MSRQILHELNPTDAGKVFMFMKRNNKYKMYIIINLFDEQPDVRTLF